MEIISSIKKFLFGYDIFISYSRSDSLDYAYSLATYFITKGYEPFIDQISNTKPGADISDNIVNAIKRSKGFVLIGSEGAQLSQDNDPIPQEIEVFLKENSSKFLIPINVDGALKVERVEINHPTITIIEKKIFGLTLYPENKTSFDRKIPSKEILDKIEQALKFTKKSSRLRRISIVILIGVIGISVIATLYSNNKTIEARNAKSETEIAKREKEKTDSLRILAENDKEQAIRDAKEATSQMNKAYTLKSEADSLKSIAERYRKNAELLKDQALYLQAIAENRADSLNIQSEMLEYRVAAMRQLESDPVTAYRLAEKAYTLNNNSQNRELLLSSLSSIDYYYKSVYYNYKIVDFKEPYILLINNKEKSSKLAVFDMKTSFVKETPLTTDRIAWIVPTSSNSYRILTRKWEGEGLDAIPEYQLWNDSYSPIGDKIFGGGLTLPNFINSSTASIKLSKQAKTLVWNLLTGEKKLISEDSTDKFGGYFRGIYGTLDTRSDGVAAAHQDNGLVLLDTSGKVISHSYTEVEFDPSSFFSKAKWSPDDSYLALNYFDVHGLGIWDPLSVSFKWLGSPYGRPFNLSKPNHWIVNSHSWSQKGHILAFSGRTENDIDVTVEIVDASSIEKTRRIVYRGEIPVQSICFLPGDDKIVICDKESNVFIVDITLKKIVGKGQQADLIYTSTSGFYSSSVANFKSWNTLPAPSKNWLFMSDSNKTYYPEGAVDPNNKWMAVPYFQKIDTTSGIELRNVLSGEIRSLNFSSDYVHRIDFSNNGNWLFLETSTELNVWDTHSWSRFQFPLIKGDKQFIDLKIESDTLHAILAEDSAEYEIEYLFDLKSLKPEFIKRLVTNRKFKDIYALESRETQLEDMVNGWITEKLYKYQAAGWSRSGNWAVRLTCRDNALGAQNCDVQFVPINLEWLMSLYNGLLWKPTDAELIKLQRELN